MSHYLNGDYHIEQTVDVHLSHNFHQHSEDFNLQLKMERLWDIGGQGNMFFVDMISPEKLSCWDFEFYNIALTWKSWHHPFFRYVVMIKSGKVKGRAVNLHHFVSCMNELSERTGSKTKASFSFLMFKPNGLLMKQLIFKSKLFLKSMPFGLNWLPLEKWLALNGKQFSME